MCMVGVVGRGPGRPSSASGGLVAVAVLVPGEPARFAVWCEVSDPDGSLSGDVDVVAAARDAAAAGVVVPTSWSGECAADLVTVEGATAALCAFSPGFTLVTESRAAVRSPSGG